MMKEIEEKQMQNGAFEVRDGQTINICIDIGNGFYVKGFRVVGFVDDKYGDIQLVPLAGPFHSSYENYVIGGEGIKI